MYIWTTRTDVEGIRCSTLKVLVQQLSGNTEENHKISVMTADPWAKNQNRNKNKSIRDF